MTTSDKVFAGSIPALYDQFLGPMLFEPFAKEMAKRAQAVAPSSVLETAAGTGIATQELLRVLPADTAITATDLNPAMLDRAAARLPVGRVLLQVSDAASLDFADSSFDLVVCQFGVMFFPDKSKALAEARRVLKPDGTLLFSVWDSLNQNILSQVVADTVADYFVGDPPDFLARTPFGYSDVARIKGDLRAAGFGDIDATRINLLSRAPSPRHVAIGLCQGTPLRAEIEARAPTELDTVTDKVTEALAVRFGPGAVTAPMQAIMVAARP